MTKRTDTQALILRAAADHPDGLAAPPASLPPAPRGAVAKALLSTGLVEVLRGTEGQDASLVWKLDGEPVFLRLTDGGLAAIGITGQGRGDVTGDPAGALGNDDAGDGAQDAAGGLGRGHAGG